MGVSNIHIRNYKSIKDSGVIPFSPINVLIGSNGVGKSNFISFFKLLNKIYNQQLQTYIGQSGGADGLLHFGTKVSDELFGAITFDNDWENGYEFSLKLSVDGLYFDEEVSTYSPSKGTSPRVGLYTDGKESVVKTDTSYRLSYLREQFDRLRVFHFHDTSFNSKMKQPSNTTDYSSLHEDGRNIASFLYLLKNKSPKEYKLILHTVRSVAPFFDDFHLTPDEMNEHTISLRWKEKGHDTLFGAHNLSDGTLRFICLTTLLLQPNPPSTIIIDEPELGLHPYAVEKLGSMIKSVSLKTQIIVSTQSVNLLSEFSPEDVLLVERNRENNSTTFTRPKVEELQEWIEGYSLGELWEKNVIGGQP